MTEYLFDLSEKNTFLPWESKKTKEIKKIMIFTLKKRSYQIQPVHYFTHQSIQTKKSIFILTLMNNLTCKALHTSTLAWPDIQN